jgi:hypothetical protein
MKVALSKWYKVIFFLLMIEARALWDGLLQARDKGMSNIHIKGDLKMVMDNIMDKISMP